MTASLTKGVFLALLLTFFTTVYAGHCEKPRVRREWRSISEGERKEWVDAVKCLKKVPHKPALTPTINVSISQIPPMNPDSSYFDDFVYAHMDLNPVIHFTGLFLPWHRNYLNDFELALRKECGYKGAHPYWDWTLDASPNFTNASIFDKYFGGWGDPNNDYQITTGAFAKDFDLVYPVPHKLRRNYTARGTNPDPFGDGTPAAPLPFWNYFTKESRDTLVNGFVGNFEDFHILFEGATGPHGAVHVILGGDMSGSCPQNLVPPACVRGPKWTSSDPLFMMHHAMIDKIWFDWQNKHRENFWSFFGGSVGSHSQPGLYRQFPAGGPPFLNLGTQMPHDGILTKATIYDVMDTKDERLCYIYK